MNIKFIKKELISLKDEKYKLFISKLLPGVDNIIGVRVPELRKIAKKIAKENWQQYLSIATDDYFEEIMLQCLVIGYVKAELSTIKPYWAPFIKKINNWSVCDTFCFGLKITEKNLDIVFKFLQPYFYSNKEFDVRFGIVMLLKWFNKPQFISQNLKIIDSIKNSSYYVEMAIAWAISVFYITSPELIYSYLKNNNLNNSVHNKSIQKIKESFKVSKENKDLVTLLKKS